MDKIFFGVAIAWYNVDVSRNPVINAIGASAYIVLVVGIMTLVTKPLQNKPDTFFAPIVFLSMLTLSVAVMAYLFFYQPVLLFIEGKKKEAIDLFFKTVGVFSVFTLVSLILLSLGVI